MSHFTPSASSRLLPSLDPPNVFPPLYCEINNLTPVTIIGICFFSNLIIFGNPVLLQILTAIPIVIMLALDHGPDMDCARSLGATLLP